MSVALQDPEWTLGNRLWRARVHARKEQAEVSLAVGVSRALISKWERDLSEPTVTQVRRYAEVTGVSFEWLVGSKTCFMALPEPAGQIPLPFDSVSPTLATVSV